MKQETSAGGVIVAVKNGQVLVLLLRDKSGQWTFPKGLIEPGEVPQETATREIAEEVGIRRVKLLSPLAPVTYFFKREGALVKKTVHYYLFENGGEEDVRPQREEGIMEVRWFGWIIAEEVIGYKKTNKQILKVAQEKLKLVL